MTYLEKLDRELRLAGIGGRRHARIMAEFTDHLASNPAAELGAPAEIARQFGGELGTSLARAAAHRAFAALAFAGLALLIGALDAAVLARRSAIGVLAGIVAVACLPVLALSFPHVGGENWHAAAWVVFGLSAIALAATLPSLSDSFRVRPRAAGRAGDLRDDLAPVLPRSLTPLRFALLLSLAIMLALGLAGVITSDPYDGFLRGLLDGAA